MNIIFWKDDFYSIAPISLCHRHIDSLLMILWLQVVFLLGCLLFQKISQTNVFYLATGRQFHLLSLVLYMVLAMCNLAEAPALCRSYNLIFLHTHVEFQNLYLQLWLLNLIAHLLDKRGDYWCSWLFDEFVFQYTMKK